MELRQERWCAGISSLVESAIYRSITAVVQKDEALANDVLKNENRINQIEIGIDEFTVSLLATQQPMATDLRFLVASLKINNDLERMGILRSTSPTAQSRC